MKHLYLVVFLFALNSLGQAGHNEVENILFDCLIHSYADAKVDLSKELDKLEVYLIENEFLASSSGQAYYDFYKKVGETNLIPSRLDYDQFEGIYKLAPNEFYSEECLEHLKKLDSTIVSTSKYFQMKVAMNEVSAGNIGPGKIAKVITSVLRPADFDSPYYRAIALLTIAYTSDSDKGLKRKIQNEMKAKEVSEEMTIALTAKNQIILNGKNVSQKELRKILRQFIKNNKANHQIHFQSDKRTIHAFYMEVEEDIKSVYSDLRNNLSNEKFSKLYDKLSENEQKEIRTVYPMRIVE